jgi:hypothetical protein
VTSKPLFNRIRATFRIAEFGFFGVVVNTLRQTPRRCGHSIKAGTLFFTVRGERGLRINWFIVGIPTPENSELHAEWEALPCDSSNTTDTIETSQGTAGNFFNKKQKKYV